MPQSFAHSSRLFRSVWRVWWSFSFLMVRYNRQSSANSRTDELTQSGRSLMWHKNMIGPKTVPWGTPESTDVSLDFSPSTIVLIILVVRKLVSHVWMLPWIPYWCNLCSNLSCGTVSKAFEKSKMATSTWCPLSCSWRKSLSVVTSCVSHE